MKPTETTMTTTEKKTYTLASGLACLGGAGRASTIWGSHVIGSLWSALQDPSLFDKQSDSLQPGDRIYLCSFADDPAFRENVRSEIASVVVLRARKSATTSDGTRVLGQVTFNRLDYFGLSDADIREFPRAAKVAA